MIHKVLFLFLSGSVAGFAMGTGSIRGLGDSTEGIHEGEGIPASLALWNFA